MQNLPDKGVSSSLYYLKADYTVTGLTLACVKVKVEMRETHAHFPLWDAVQPQIPFGAHLYDLLLQGLEPWLIRARLPRRCKPCVTCF
jgi:hypothetical protein